MSRIVTECQTEYDLAICDLSSSKSLKALGFDRPCTHFWTNRWITAEEREAGYNFDDNKPPYKLCEHEVGESDKYITVSDVQQHTPHDVTAPELVLAANWIRVKHNVHIYTTCSMSNGLWQYVILTVNRITNISDNDIHSISSNEFASHELALQTGISRYLSINDLY